MKNFDIVLIGGGAAALAFCAKIEKKFSVAVCERNLRVGKKLLATGNGRGNFSNECVSPHNFHGDIQFAGQIIKRFSTKDCTDFFESLGMFWQSEDGKIYPVTFSANTILDILRKKAQENNIEFICGFFAEDVNYDELQKKFFIKNKNEIISCTNLIVSAGGKSGSGFGTDGSAYGLLQKFGHTLSKTHPSLVQLRADIANVKPLKGLKVEANFTYVDNGKEVYKNKGEVLFCDYGLSGNAIFDVSSRLCGCNFENTYIFIDFFPQYDVQYLIDIISARKEDPLLGITRNQLSNCVYKMTTDKSGYAKLLKEFPIKLLGTKGFESSQVTAGGILTKDFNGYDLQSRLQNNLYAIGEVLNVDGDCGGYNLHFAFACGYLCAEAINKTI